MYGLFKDGELVGRWCHESPGMVWSQNSDDFPDMQVSIAGMGDRELLNGQTPTRVDKHGSWKLAPGYEIKELPTGGLNEDNLRNHRIEL